MKIRIDLTALPPRRAEEEFRQYGFLLWHYVELTFGIPRGFRFQDPLLKRIARGKRQ